VIVAKRAIKLMPLLPVRSICCRGGVRVDGDAEEGAEGGIASAAAVEAEDEFIKIGLKVLVAQAFRCVNIAKVSNGEPDVADVLMGRSQ
jgi:hypothetical protein